MEIIFLCVISCGTFSIVVNHCDSLFSYRLIHFDLYQVDLVRDSVRVQRWAPHAHFGKSPLLTYSSRWRYRVSDSEMEAFSSTPLQCILSR